MAPRGKVAIVTGAGSGIGSHVARHFAKKGFTVVLAGRTVEKLESVAMEIEAEGGTAHHVQTDVSDPEQIKNLFDRASEKGDIQYVVNNAAMDWTKSAEETSEKEREKLWATNVGSVEESMKQALKHMKNGSVINISSGSAHDENPTPELELYSKTKKEVNELTEQNANTFKEKGLSVHSISMGAVRTGLHEKAFRKLMPDLTDVQIAKHMDSLDLPEEVGQKIVELCLDKSRLDKTLFYYNEIME